MTEIYFDPKIDSAHFIIREASIAALLECQRLGHSCEVAYLALIQECLTRYGELLGSNSEALRITRILLNAWEAENTNSPHIKA